MSAQLLEHAVEAGRARDATLSRETRRAHGVVHTPAELARWAMAQVDDRLRSTLRLDAGLRSPRLALLDPALGTGVWLAAALERMATQNAENVQGPRLLGFDVDEAALGQTRTLLSDAAARADAQLSLTHANMLTVADPFGPTLREHVRVIVGNPPWAARSRSRGLTLSDAWLAEFRSDAHGVSLGERRSGVLSDDYVRFFRWALQQVRESQAGAVLCFATNSSYLDGPVHRGMRAALVKAFDEIEILDLGGNALRGGDGARDENVFGVRVGTCLLLGVRKPGQAERNAPITYTKLSGSREQKLAWLSQRPPEPSTRFISQAPSFRFVPTKASTSSSQIHTFSLAEALPFHREGVQTNRDAFVTDTDRARLVARLHAFAEGKVDLPSAPQISEATSRALLKKNLESDEQSLIRELAYRPLDQRYYFSLAPFCHRPRPDLFRAVEHSSLCLLSARKDRGEGKWNLYGVARTSADGCYLSTRSSCRTRVFPTHTPAGDENLDPRFHDALSNRINHDVTSTQLIAYALGVLASASFRSDHDALLHEDYARIPWPRDAAMFDLHRQAGDAWLNAWLAPAASELKSGLRASHALTYDLERALLKWGDHSLEIAPELWRFSIGDFPVLSQLSRRCVSWGRVFAAIQRVSACVEASARAERAYQLTRPVR